MPVERPHGLDRALPLPDVLRVPVPGGRGLRADGRPGVRAFCIDAINIDETPDETHPGVGFPSHHLISRLGVIGEDFRLEGLPVGDFLVACTPIRLTGADEGPVRAVAIELGP